MGQNAVRHFHRKNLEKIIEKRENALDIRRDILYYK